VADNNTITLPDVGDFKDIEIIEVLIAVGDDIEAEQSIIILESDKATMEIPSPFAGKVESIAVKVGDKLNEGDQVATLSGAGASAGEAKGETQAKQAAPVASEPAPLAAPQSPPVEPAAAPKSGAVPGKPLRPHPGASGGDVTGANSKMIHASPSIRRYARELGVNLDQVIGSGPKGRIVKSDVKAFVKTAMSGTVPGGSVAGGGISISAMPEIDHSRFGEVETAQSYQEDIWRSSASQLGHGTPRHPVRRSRYHRTRSVSQIARQGCGEKGRAHDATDFPDEGGGEGDAGIS